MRDEGQSLRRKDQGRRASPPVKRDLKAMTCKPSTPSSRYRIQMAEYRFTDYFEKEVLRKRPYLRKEWCSRVLDAPIRSEPQDKNRYRFWAEIPELADRYLRVITLEDKVTIHNAFPDRRFKP